MILLYFLILYALIMTVLVVWLIWLHHKREKMLTDLLVDAIGEAVPAYQRRHSDAY